MSKNDDRFFEMSYAAGTDVWSGLKERDAALKRFLDSIGDAPPALLDIGCGVARHAKIVCERNIEYFGIDKAKECLGQAHENIRGLDAWLTTGDIRSRVCNLSFRAVIDFACFTHFRETEQQAYLDVLSSYTRAGSYFLLSVWSAESTQAYGVTFDDDTRDCVAGHHGGVYTRLFSVADIKAIFGRDWEIASSDIVVLKKEPVIGLKHLFVTMWRR